MQGVATSLLEALRARLLKMHFTVAARKEELLCCQVLVIVRLVDAEARLAFHTMEKLVPTALFAHAAVLAVKVALAQIVVKGTAFAAEVLPELYLTVSAELGWLLNCEA